MTVRRPGGAEAQPDGPVGIVFDFDGVLVESVDIKTEAFRTLFAEEERLDDILAFHRAQGGMSRFDKLRVIYRDILMRPIDSAMIDRLAGRFSVLVREAVLRCPEVPGATAYLRARAAEGLPMFVASATPEPELRDIVQGRGLAGFFRGVFGSPRPKGDIVRDILQAEGGDPAGWWFIGDAINDVAAAASVGMTFIGRVRAGEPDVFPADARRIADLTDLIEQDAPFRGASDTTG